MVPPILSRFLSEYGMVLVLLLLCGYYSFATYAEQDPGGAAGGEQLARDVQQLAAADRRFGSRLSNRHDRRSASSVSPVLAQTLKCRSPSAMDQSVVR